ncbi:MAG: DUF2842 domain-containing protein [Pseudomonadota bacterium]|nr:DUF2842 domain-containing protein [Pseudomonadota bacterium]
MNIFYRKILAYLILLVFLPIYIIFAVTIVSLIDRLNIWVELIIYIVLGIAWVFPFKLIFKGLAVKKKKI